MKRSFIGLLLNGILVLIKIGDGVIFLTKLPFTLINICARVIVTFFVLFYRLVHFCIVSIFHMLKKGISGFVSFALSLLTFPKRIFSSPPRLPEIKPYTIPQKPQPKKQKRNETIVAFRLISFATKLKYFFIGILFSFICLFIPLLVFIYIQDLPNPTELSLRPIPQTTKIYDRKGTLLYQIYATQNRTIVPLAEIPSFLQKATIAIEDKDFYNHPGFDLSAIIRAAISDLSGKPLQGGSTITQQLIKSSLLTSERTFTRKTKEILLAFMAERIYSKDEILAMYFNYVPYGGTAWGVEAASQLYFNKSVKDLSLSESAFLAGMPEAPSIYSPYGLYPNVWKNRQKEVLSRMQELGFITKDQMNQALNEQLVFQPRPNPLRAPHFVWYVRDLLIQKYGIHMVEKGGLTVTTSLDLLVQDMAQKIVTEEVQNNTNLNLTNGAALVTNPQNGDILAMIGSKDYDDINGGAVNLTNSFRQPGSSIKPVTYTLALMKGFTPATTIDDSPVSFPSASGRYAPVNYDGQFHGRVTLRSALGNSFNIPAVKTLNSVGIPAFVDLAKKMGIKSWGSADRYGLSITLGSAEVSMVDMATVYGVFANSGERVDVNPFLKVTDANGNILEEKITNARQNAEVTGTTITRKRVLDPAIAFIISDILSDNSARVMEFGPDSPLKITSRKVSVKTGTSDNKRDNWTIGYTPNILVAVWVGNNDNTPMSQSLASGITGAAPIWNKIMNTMITKVPDIKVSPPQNIIQKPCGGRIEYFVKGTENSVYCTIIPTSSPTPKP